MDDWRDVLFRIGWGRTRPHALDDVALERQRVRIARYRALRDAGLELLSAGDCAGAIDALAAAATLRRGMPEAHINLARAFEAAGRLEAARQSLEIGLHFAERRGDRGAAIELSGRLTSLPARPPGRADFAKDQVVYSGLTGSRWTVLDAKFGGMGVVYKVRDHSDGVIHALKTLQAQYLWSDSDRERFIREAATWVRLDSHPYIVAAEWIELIEDCPALVMEWVEGGDLASLLSSQPLALDRALDLAIRFCDGMAFAHRTLGIVHRDIKPANCLLDARGCLKIGDFGLARSFLENRCAAPELCGTSRARVQMTSPYGTPPYMAPEQLDPEASLDCRADVHAFGVMLYEMLTAELPEDLLDQPARLDLEHVKRVARRRKLPHRLADLMLSCMAPDTVDRPSDFDEVRLELATVMGKRFRRHVQPSPMPLPVDARFWNNKAVGFQALERYEDAVSCYDRALELSPRDSDLWQNKGAALICLERYADAISCLDVALAVSPNDPDILNNKGHALMKLGQFDAALDYLRRAARVAPKDPIVCKNMAEALCVSGRPEEGLDWIRRGLVIDPRNPALIELQGFSCLMLGHGDDALACFEQGLPIAPRRSGLWKGKAIAHSRRLEHSEALTASNRALELSPNDLTVLKCKVEALCGLGDIGSARSVVDLFARLAPGDPRLMEMRATVDAGTLPTDDPSTALNRQING